MSRLLVPLALVLTATAASGQELFVVDRTNQRLVLVDGQDGTVLDPNRIDLTLSGGTAPVQPVQVARVAQQYWITDAGAGVVFRFTVDGAYISEFGSIRDGVSGIAWAQPHAWVANAGGALGSALKRYDSIGTLLEFKDVSAESEPSSLVVFDGTFLVGDVAGHDVDRYDLDGNFLSTFHDGDGIGGLETPRQVSIRGGSPSVFVADAGSPAGIRELDASGAQVGFVDLEALGHTGITGVRELGDGNLLFTDPTGIHVYDVNAGSVTTVLAGVDGGYVTALSEPGSTELYCDESENPNNVADISIDTIDTSAPSLVVRMANAPPNQSTILLVGNGANKITLPPGSKGTLCVAGGTCLGRYAIDIGIVASDGTKFLDIKNALSNPCAGEVVLVPGATWNFQWWHRQPMGAPSSFSSAIAVTFE